MLKKLLLPLKRTYKYKTFLRTIIFIGNNKENKASNKFYITTSHRRTLVKEISKILCFCLEFYNIYLSSQTFALLKIFGFLAFNIYIVSLLLITEINFQKCVTTDSEHSYQYAHSIHQTLNKYIYSERISK